MRAAKKNHAPSQYHLGSLYEKGLGVGRDVDQALVWYIKSGNHGCFDAQIKMCKIYQKGALGVEKSQTKALYWLRDITFSMDKSLRYIPGYKFYLLGQLWEEGGCEVGQDYKKAFECYTYANEEGYLDAKLKLGQFYLQGKGVIQDHKKALEVLLSSIKKESQDSLVYYYVGEIYENEDQFTKAIEYYVQASRLGVTKAPYKLALLYYYGRGVPIDHKSALFWFKRSVDIEETSKAQHYMAVIYMEEDGPVRQNYGAALEWLQLSADQNYAESQYLLGRLHMEVYLNTSKALHWFMKSLENGLSDARYDVGLLYVNGGGGIKIDYKQAFFFLKDVDNNTHVKSSSGIIGTMFYNGGYGIEKDYKQALFWFFKCDGGASSENFNTIGKMYYAGGFGIQKNLKEALTWFLKAINNGHLESYVSLGHLYATGGYGVAQDYQAAHDYLIEGVNNKVAGSMYFLGILFTSRNDNEQDFRKALSWFKKAAKHGDTLSQIWIGIFYIKGLGVEQNYVEAKRWFEKASNNPFGEIAFVYIGWLYHKGLGVPCSYNRAFELYKVALETEKNDEARRYAYVCLGLLYQDGLGVSQSYYRAKDYFQKAVNLEDKDGYNCMGNIYMYGYGVNVDYDEAFMWYLKCAKACENTLYVCDEGWLNLGKMYLNGLGTNRSTELALFYLRKALKYGNPDAQEHINQTIDLQNKIASTPSAYIAETEEFMQRSMSVELLKDISLKVIFDETIAKLKKLSIRVEKGRDQGEEAENAIEEDTFDTKERESSKSSRSKHDSNTNEKEKPRNFFYVEDVSIEILKTKQDNENTSDHQES